MQGNNEENTQAYYWKNEEDFLLKMLVFLRYSSIFIFKFELSQIDFSRIRTRCHSNSGKQAKSKYRGASLF